MSLEVSSRLGGAEDGGGGGGDKGTPVEASDSPASPPTLLGRTELPMSKEPSACDAPRLEAENLSLETDDFARLELTDRDDFSLRGEV